MRNVPTRKKSSKSTVKGYYDDKSLDIRNKRTMVNKRSTK